MPKAKRITVSLKPPEHAKLTAHAKMKHTTPAFEARIAIINHVERKAK